MTERSCSGKSARALFGFYCTTIRSNHSKFEFVRLALLSPDFLGRLGAIAWLDSIWFFYGALQLNRRRAARQELAVACGADEGLILADHLAV